MNIIGLIKKQGTHPDTLSFKHLTHKIKKQLLDKIKIAFTVNYLLTLPSLSPMFLNTFHFT